MGLDPGGNLSWASHWQRDRKVLENWLGNVRLTNWQSRVWPGQWVTWPPGFSTPHPPPMSKVQMEGYKSEMLTLFLSLHRCCLTWVLFRHFMLFKISQNHQIGLVQKEAIWPIVSAPALRMNSSPNSILPPSPCNPAHSSFSGNSLIPFRMPQLNLPPPQSQAVHSRL